MKKLVVKHGKKKKVYNLNYTATAEEQLLYTEKIHAEIKAWLDIEKQYAIKDSGNNWLHTLSQFDPKTMAYTDHEASIQLKDELLNKFSGTISRIIDLEIEICMVVPAPFIEAVKGRIYSKLFSYEIMYFPRKEEWAQLIIEYPFLWLVFLCKNRMDTTQLASKDW